MTAGLEPVSAEAARQSPLSGRMILAVDGRTWPDWIDLERAPEVVRCSSSGIFSVGLPRLFGNHQSGGGVSSLAPHSTFVDCVRALADTLLDPGPAGWVVESVEAGAAADLAQVVYPDAPVANTAADLRSVLAAPTPEGGPGMAAPPELTDRLILVVGAPRSGTTWFERLLRSHPQTGGAQDAETWLFVGLADLWRNHRTGSGLADLVDESRLAGSLRAFSCRLLGHAMAQVPGATWFVEKTPGHVFLLRDIAAVWPDAWVVHLVRDGRDVARSGVEMVHGPNDLREAAAGWAAAIAAADDQGVAVPRFREVRYEALLEDPVGVTAGVLEWVGLDVGETTRTQMAAVAGRRVSQYNTTGPVGAGKWRSLDPAAVRAILEVAGPALLARGYVTADELPGVGRGAGARLVRRLRRR